MAEKKNTETIKSVDALKASENIEEVSTQKIKEKISKLKDGEVLQITFENINDRGLL